MQLSMRSGSSEIQRIARERIRILFQRAEDVYPADPCLAERYVHLARRIAMRHRIRIPRELKRRFCRSCDAFMVPGYSSRVRVHRHKVIITCLRCKRQQRYPLVRRG
ncbi:MAG: ribonuclease P [Methanomicrobiales archaeon]|nr:ribonuclease P [Methanomicrobiales archaeon]